MKQRHLNLLSELTSVCSISGYTTDTADLYVREASRLGLLTGRDVIGSVSAHIPSQVQISNVKNILIIAHLDTVGYIIQEIRKDKIQLAKVGLPGLCRDHPGTVKTKHGNVHLTIKDDGEEVDCAEAVLDNDDDTSKLRVGDPVYYRRALEEYPQGKITSPYLDNKAGVLVLLMAMEKIVKQKKNAHNLYFVLPDMEETGSYGAAAAAEKIRPMFAINVDVFPVEHRMELSSGTIISRGSVYNEILVDRCEEIAINNKIPYKFGVAGTLFESDVNAILGRAGGIACCEINIPCYNMHLPDEIVSKKSLESTAKMLVELCNTAHLITNLVPGG